jgi:hypothetical protein
MQAAVVGAFMIVGSFGLRFKLSTIMVRLPSVTNTQSLYADRCINMHKGQRPLFGRVGCRD